MSVPFWRGSALLSAFWPVALLLCLFSGGLAMYGYLRWLRNEKAMRLKEDLPYTNSLLIISLILMIVAVIVMGLVLYAG